MGDVVRRRGSDQMAIILCPHYVLIRTYDILYPHIDSNGDLLFVENVGMHGINVAHNDLEIVAPMEDFKDEDERDAMVEVSYALIDT